MREGGSGVTRLAVIRRGRVRLIQCAPLPERNLVVIVRRPAEENDDRRSDIHTAARNPRQHSTSSTGAMQLCDRCSERPCPRIGPIPDPPACGRVHSNQSIIVSQLRGPIQEPCARPGRRGTVRKVDGGCISLGGGGLGKDVPEDVRCQGGGEKDERQQRKGGGDEASWTRKEQKEGMSAASSLLSRMRR